MGFGSDGVGARLLGKMGWKPGTGLGARRDGATESVIVKKKKENRGIGATGTKFNHMWWLHAFEDALKRHNEDATEEKDDKERSIDARKAYNVADGRKLRMDDDVLFKQCGGRRCRPHGASKLERLRSQDSGVGELEGIVLKSEKAPISADELKKRKKKSKENSEKSNSRKKGLRKKKG